MVVWYPYVADTIVETRLNLPVCSEYHKAETWVDSESTH